MPLLKHFAKTFRKCFGGFSNHLPTENMIRCILDDLGFFFTVIAVQLTKILKAETDRHLVDSGSSNEVIQSTKIDGRQLINDDSALKLFFFIDEFIDAGIV